MSVADSAPTATELVGKALAARQSVQSGEVELHFEIVDPQTGAAARGRMLDFHIWFDFIEVRRIRADLTRHGKIVGKVKGENQPVTTVSNEGRSIWRHVLTDEYFISWSPDELTNGMTLGARYGSLENLDSVPSVKTEIIDPRLVGMTTSSYGHFIHQDLQSFIGLFRGKEATVTREKVNGRMIWKIEAPVGNDTARIWTDPGMGYNLVKGQSLIQLSHGDEKDRLMVATFETDLVHYPDAGVWFPKLVTLSIVIDGKLVSTERHVVRLARLNVPIDPEVFTLAGVGLRPGTRVIDQTGAKVANRIWDGEKLTSIWPRADIAAQVGPAAEKFAFAWQFWLVTGNLVALAMIFLWAGIRSFRRRSTTGDPNDDS